jgi:hypothetical protein
MKLVKTALRIASAVSLLSVACAYGATPAASEPSTGGAIPTEPPPAPAPAPTPTPANTATDTPTPTLPPTSGAPTAEAPPDDPCRVGRKIGRGSLDDVLAQRRCKVEQPQWIEPYDTADLAIRADPSSLRVQRGAHADLFVQIVARRDTIVQLEVGCADDVSTSVHDAKGQRIDETGGAMATLCMREVLHVRLGAGDEVGISVPFLARKYRWVGASRADAGPLPAGNFELWLTLPIAVGKQWQRSVVKIPLEVTR